MEFREGGTAQRQRRGVNASRSRHIGGKTRLRLGKTARGRDVRCPKSPSLALVSSKRLFFGVARPPQTAGRESLFLLFFRLRAYIQNARTPHSLGPAVLHASALFLRMSKRIRWAKRRRLGFCVRASGAVKWGVKYVNTPSEFKENCKSSSTRSSDGRELQECARNRRYARASAVSGPMCCTRAAVGRNSCIQ